MIHFTTAITALLAGMATTSSAASSHDARAIRNSTSKVAAASTSFWYANMDHVGATRGYAPDLDKDYTYDVFKTVNSGDGRAIQATIDDNNGKERMSQWWASQTRIVYLPPGTYEVDSEILMRVGTILMGDATNPPTIKASRNWQGNSRLINGLDRQTNGHGELSFTVGLKNVILDTTNIGGDFDAVYWRVAQGAHMQNVKIVMPTSGPTSGHTGVHVGQGSSLGLSDVRVERGWNGIWHDGHQQMAYKNINFFQNTNGMRVTGGNVITVAGSTFDTVAKGVVHDGGSPWIALVDCKSINSGATFSTTQYPSLLIENLERDDDRVVVEWGSNHDPVLTNSRHVDQFTYANTYGQNPIYGPNKDGASKRPSALVQGGKYPSIVAPNYADKTAADFINIKDPQQNGGHKVLGDHTVDESGVLNQILQYAAQQGKIAYFPFGKYRVDSTLFVPPGSQIVGEAWSTIMGSGPYFNSTNSPKPVVAIGKEGDAGIAHIQDMRITVADRLPGAILAQVNMAGNAPGDVAIWNTLITLGGTAGSDDINNNCYDYNNECRGAFLGLHLTKSSSAYIENTWVWVADHNSEGGGGCAIAAKGGVLVQATKGTWLHSLGSEHWWLYQLNLWEAKNVFVSMLQAETNYNQGSNAPQLPPAPWMADIQQWNDPDFSWCGGGDGYCRKGLSNYITGGSGIRHYSSAAWDFFQGPNYDSCDKKDVDPWRCINVMHWISKQPSDLQMFGVCSKGAPNVLREANGNFISARPSFTGGWPNSGSDLGVYKIA